MSRRRKNASGKSSLFGSTKTVRRKTTSLTTVTTTSKHIASACRKNCWRSAAKYNHRWSRRATVIVTKLRSVKKISNGNNFGNITNRATNACAVAGPFYEVMQGRTLAQLAASRLCLFALRLPPYKTNKAVTQLRLLSSPSDHHPCVHCASWGQRRCWRWRLWGQCRQRLRSICSCNNYLWMFSFQRG